MLRLASLALCVGLAATGCDADATASDRSGPVGDPGGTSTSTSGVVAGLPAVPVAGPCTAAGATEIALAPANPPEAVLLPSLRVCRSPQADSRSQLEVINAGPGVWVVDGIPGWDAQSLTTTDAAVTLFRHSTAGTYQGLAIEPGERGYLRVGAGYQLRLSLDAGLQVQWLVVSRSVEAAQSRLREQALRPLSPQGRAVIACGRAAYALAGKVRASADATTGDELLALVSKGTTEAQPCLTAVDAAQQDARARGQAGLTLEDFRPTNLLQGRARLEAERGLRLSARAARVLGLVR